MNFLVGGGLIASGPFSTTTTGQWRYRGDGTYDTLLAEFMYDPASAGVTQVVTPNARYRLDPAKNSLALISDVSTIYIYDPMSGALLSTFKLVTNSTDADPAITVKSQRIGLGWVPPSQFPPEPPAQA